MTAPGPRQGRPLSGPRRAWRAGMAAFIVTAVVFGTELALSIEDARDRLILLAGIHAVVHAAETGQPLPVQPPDSLP